MQTESEKEDIGDAETTSERPALLDDLVNELTVSAQAQKLMLANFSGQLATHTAVSSASEVASHAEMIHQLREDLHALQERLERQDSTERIPASLSRVEGAWNDEVCAAVSRCVDKLGVELRSDLTTRFNVASRKLREEFTARLDVLFTSIASVRGELVPRLEKFEEALQPVSSAPIRLEALEASLQRLSEPRSRSSTGQTHELFSFARSRKQEVGFADECERTVAVRIPDGKEGEQIVNLRELPSLHSPSKARRLLSHVSQDGEEQPLETSRTRETDELLRTSETLAPVPAVTKTSDAVPKTAVCINFDVTAAGHAPTVQEVVQARLMSAPMESPYAMHVRGRSVSPRKPSWVPVVNAGPASARVDGRQVDHASLLHSLSAGGQLSTIQQATVIASKLNHVMHDPASSPVTGNRSGAYSPMPSIPSPISLSETTRPAKAVPVSSRLTATPRPRDVQNGDVGTGGRQIPFKCPSGRMGTPPPAIVFSPSVTVKPTCHLARSASVRHVRPEVPR